MPEVSTRNTGPLRPIELATAAVMAGVSVVLTVIGWFLPHLGVVAALAVVPLGLVAFRHRIRALMAAAFAASVVSFLVAGTGTVSNIVECSVVGGIVGVSRRRGWSFAAVTAEAAVAGPVLGAIAVGLLALFSSLRKLTLEQIRNTWKGIRKVGAGFAHIGDLLGRSVLSALRGAHLGGAAKSLHNFGSSVPNLAGAGAALDRFVVVIVRDWWISVGAIVVATTLWFTLVSWLLLGAVLPRLERIRVTDRIDLMPEEGQPEPVPVALRGAGYRYPGADMDALMGVSLTVSPGELVALYGDNGSGKSTLARILAGRAPTSGEVVRPGAAGLGQPGGTALIMQHPETQILGVRVADDVVWGLKDDHDVDVADLLRSVGLPGMQDRETSTLSGGELQRLAVAAALARHPNLLISDESTAMVDGDGRRLLTGLLRDLPESHGMAVVHVTHRHEEVRLADRCFGLSHGRLVTDGNGSVKANGASRPSAWAVGSGSDQDPSGRKEPPRLELINVSHTYGIGSPWAQPALYDVSLVVEPQQGVLIVGGNGSGKSTVAWIMAGLLRPTRGACLLGGGFVTRQVGSVGLAFQHARLQLQRSTVGKDLKAAGALDDAAVAAALESVRLDVDEFVERRVDELSGGQQRRVALAGILARRPSVLVLDEPLAGLDEPSRLGLLDLLVDLRELHGLTVIVISHDLDGMERLCHRVIRLEGGRIARDDIAENAPC